MRAWRTRRQAAFARSLVSAPRGRLRGRRTVPGLRWQAVEGSAQPRWCSIATRAAHAGDAVVEDAAVEITVNGRLHAAAQVAVTRLKALLVDEQEALEVMREGPVEDRALGMARSIDPGTCRGFGRLHSTEGRRNRRPQACGRAATTRPGSFASQGSLQNRLSCAGIEVR